MLEDAGKREDIHRHPVDIIVQIQTITAVQPISVLIRSHNDAHWPSQRGQILQAVFADVANKWCIVGTG